jgi:peptide/nickel transport system permease protein
MAIRDQAVAGAESGLGPWDEAQPALPIRAWRGVVSFSRRKPLGAFGAFLLLLPVVAAIVLPGLDFGLFELPRLIKYGHEEYVLGEDVLEGPSWDHPMGTDQLGRDLFSRLLYGSRLSYIIGWSVFAISSTISTVLTIVSAYYVRSVDLVMQRVVEIIGFLPDLILLIALFSIYGATPLTLILTLGILNGISTGRVLRALVIQVRAMPYIEAARAMGASDRRIILKHVLPQLIFLIIITSTGGLAAAVLAESGLAILGFGINPTYPTLGNLLNGSRQFLRVAPHLAIFPGVIIFMLLLGSRLLGDALRDVLDPRLRGSGR